MHTNGQMMRSVKDRIRHALLFETLGILLATPLSVWVFHKPFWDMGLVVIASATVATGWNYIYNLGFDHALVWLVGHVQKSLPLRIFHAVLFEAGLLALLLPFIAWYLEISLITALQMDVSLSVFYVFYAFVFNWLYDVIFPVSKTTAEQVHAMSQRP